ncbi:phosphotransferase [Mitsuokella sp.]|uniref:phosphotransferase n=1 Tax=Mitsuokella sp. TaxID=2049034 RepID=UPI003D7E206E
MNRVEFDLLNQAYNASIGRAKITKDINMNLAVKDREAYRQLQQDGLLATDGALTQLGLKALQSYKVDNAVILAAGSASRFIPLSLEQPKALYEVKGERLIERQIQQLLEAGIDDITIVLGYKKEMFQYLKEKYPVKFVFNPSYNIKNNIESLYLCRDRLKNTYICVCDSYFSENPFNAYEYDSFYAGYSTAHKEDEMFAICDPVGRIVDMQKSMDRGYVLLGHSFWKASFAKKFLELAGLDHDIGKYDNMFWEWLVKDNLSILPPFYFKEYEKGMIHEFDYFEQLREFDRHYLEYSHSEIIRNIKLVFRCDEEDVVDFRPVSEGMTNTSFIFKIQGTDYIYRHPGDGTENIINRRNEKNSLILAKRFGIDPTYIYMDVNEGWKISKFIHHFREPDYRDFADSQKVIAVLRQLHEIPEKTDYGMKPWEDALSMEQMLRSADEHNFDQYGPLKNKIEQLYQKTLSDDVQKCFCHGDTYKPNWMIRDDGSVILIDWEYSGYSDPGIDVGYYIVDAMYDFDEAKRFIDEYLGDSSTPERKFHFWAYTAIIAYYWFVWALYRESCGADMGDALQNWHDMAVKYADFLLND